MDDSNWKDPSPWVPITKLIDLKHLGKLGEEVNELGAAVSRCIIQGMDGLEPVTKKPNIELLEDEIADVLANAELNMQHFELNKQRIIERKIRKMLHLKRWHQMLEHKE